MEFKYQTFPEAYTDLVYLIQRLGKIEHTRNGPAYVFQEPVVLRIADPRSRVVSDPVRDANPFFHVMETVWMLAGYQSIDWLQQFNKNIAQYADDGRILGAYGDRWFRHFGNQVGKIAKMLRDEPTTRQAVLQMWDPHADLGTDHKDRPCNTNIYFRCVNDALDMTICNRSNDLVWGMFGANCVHMSYLHELIATAVDQKVGRYTVFSNNLHFYLDLYPNGKEILSQGDVLHSVYPEYRQPILFGDEHWFGLTQEAKKFISGKEVTYSWLKGTAEPMRDAYFARTYEGGMAHLRLVQSDDWRINGEQWMERHRAKS